MKYGKNRSNKNQSLNGMKYFIKQYNNFEEKMKFIQ